jgi:hypothetical protein
VATQNRQGIGFGVSIKGDHATFVASLPPGGTETKKVGQQRVSGEVSAPGPARSGQIQPPTHQVTPVDAWFSPFRAPVPTREWVVQAIPHQLTPLDAGLPFPGPP